MECRSYTICTEVYRICNEAQSHKHCVGQMNAFAGLNGLIP